VHALLVWHVAPGLVAGLAGLRYRARAPQLLARPRVECGDHAGFRSAFGLAAAARDDLAVRDDRPRAVLRAGAIVEDEAFPYELAGLGVDRIGPAVRAVVENQIAVDRDVAIGARGRKVFADVRRHGTAILPEQVAGRRVVRLRDVVRIREVEHAVV